MLTDQDIIRMKEVFLEKEDFLKTIDFYITKQEHEYDLAELVAHMATKEDLVDLEERITSKFRTEMRVEMKNQFAIYLSPIVSNLKESNEKQRELDEKFERIMTIADRIFVPIDDLRLENAMSAAQYRRQVEWNHKVAEKVDVQFDY
jgi:hypothetical protein